MRVLYLSKASVVAAHRDKLRWLSHAVELETIVPDRWSGWEPPSDAEGIEITRLPVLFPDHNHFHLYRGLGAAIDRFRPDILHIDEEPYSAVTFQAGWAARRRRIPFVYFAAQNVPKRYPQPFHRLRRWVFDNASGGIAGTQQAADVLLRFGYENPLRIIPQMGVDPGVFVPDRKRNRGGGERFGFPVGAIVVAFLGRLVPEKGIDLLLDALPQVPDAYCMVVGDGPERAALEARAEANGVADRVRFPGPVPSLEVPELLRGIDVLCLPSRTTPRGAEQFGRVLVESMSTEVPVVVTECGGMPAVVDDAGLIVPMNDVDALAGALRSLVDDADLRSKLGRRGRARVLEEFSQESVVRHTLHFYEEILQGWA